MIRKFNNGARVELTEDYGTRKTGERGTVESTSLGCDSFLVKVRMDRQSSNGSYNMECYERRIKLCVDAQPQVAPLPLNAMQMVVASADRIFPRRSYDTILKSLMEEMGELSTEIAIAQGTKKRAASSDGIKGEAVDVFVVAMDMLRAAWGDELFSAQFNAKVASKLAKWEAVK